MTETPDRPAWRTPRAWAWVMIVGVGALALDLVTKSLAFARIADQPVVLDRATVIATEELHDLIPMHEPTTVVPGLLQLTLVLNDGAVFGIAAGQRWFFVAFTALALLFCIYMFAAWTGARDRLAHTAIALVVAGGLGNLYDRLRFACVRDFLHFLPDVKLPFGWSWPGGEREVWPYVSNIADAELIVGIALLLLISLRPHPKPAKTEAGEETDATPTAESSKASSESASPASGNSASGE